MSLGLCLLINKISDYRNDDGTGTVNVVLWVQVPPPTALN